MSIGHVIFTNSANCCCLTGEGALVGVCDMESISLLFVKGEGDRVNQRTLVFIVECKRG